MGRKNTTSIYKGVMYARKGRWDKKYTWFAVCVIRGIVNWRSVHETEREAAIAYDKKMIELGKEPVNILKRK
jgi:hypothetical protein